MPHSGALGERCAAASLHRKPALTGGPALRALAGELELPLLDPSASSDGDGGNESADLGGRGASRVEGPTGANLHVAWQKSSTASDNLLNSKAEYMANSLTRITMKEDPWEMKERTRKEEEQEELVKKQVEEFKRRKSIQPWSTSTDKETSSQPSQLTSQEISSQNLSLPSQSSHDTSGGGGGVHTLTGTECNIVCYETDEEEFTRPGSVEPSEHQLFSTQAKISTYTTPRSKKTSKPNQLCPSGLQCRLHRPC